MSKTLNDDTIKEFIQNHLSVQDFAYLVVPDDKRLNEEALSYIKKAFKVFIESEQANEEDG